MSSGNRVIVTGPASTWERQYRTLSINYYADGSLPVSQGRDSRLSQG
ncbi:MAG: hypothetical protein C4551_02775 [Bacillota bacterium]|nr:MAG: hypothetical protein C4551_02775 [Bacillota bacterium]